MLKKVGVGIAVVVVVLIVGVVAAGLLLPNEFEVTTTFKIDRPTDDVHACAADLANWGTILMETDRDRFEATGKGVDATAVWYSALGDAEHPVRVSQIESPSLVEVSWDGTAGPVSMLITVTADGEGAVVERHLRMTGSYPLLSAIGYRVLVEPNREALKVNGDRRFLEACGAAR